MMGTIAAIISLTIGWLFLGMYGYILTVQGIKDSCNRKWRKKQVFLVPLMGFLGIFSLLSGMVLTSIKRNPRYDR